MVDSHCQTEIIVLYVESFISFPFVLLLLQDTCLCEDEDFIVFAEFSEVKGPVALFTVPSYIQDDEKIDVNSFIMRIMSVDYQANLG